MKRWRLAGLLIVIACVPGSASANPRQLAPPFTSATGTPLTANGCPLGSSYYGCTTFASADPSGAFDLAASLTGIIRGFGCFSDLNRSVEASSKFVADANGDQSEGTPISAMVHVDHLVALSRGIDGPVFYQDESLVGSMSGFLVDQTTGEKAPIASVAHTFITGPEDSLLTTSVPPHSFPSGDPVLLEITVSVVGTVYSGLELICTTPPAGWSDVLAATGQVTSVTLGS